MIDHDNFIIESLYSIHFNEPHPIKLPSNRGKNIVYGMVTSIHREFMFQNLMIRSDQTSDRIRYLFSHTTSFYWNQKQQSNKN